MTLNKVNGCNDVLFGDHGVLEGDRIPPLNSHGQALEEELSEASRPREATILRAVWLYPHRMRLWRK